MHMLVVLVVPVCSFMVHGIIEPYEFRGKWPCLFGRHNAVANPIDHNLFFFWPRREKQPGNI